MSDAARALAAGVAAEFRRRLCGEYVPRIARCVQMLGEADVWRRPVPNCNSVGNLLLHLCGNTTQWILATFSDLADARDRKGEFAAEEGASGQELVERLRAVAENAARVVDGLSVDELLKVRTIQQRYRETGLQAVLHVMEHFSGHAGQIYAWTKQVTGKDLAFYDL